MVIQRNQIPLNLRLGQYVEEWLRALDENPPTPEIREVLARDSMEAVDYAIERIGRMIKENLEYSSKRGDISDFQRKGFAALLQIWIDYHRKDSSKTAS